MSQAQNRERIREEGGGGEGGKREERDEEAEAAADGDGDGERAQAESLNWRLHKAMREELALLQARAPPTRPPALRPKSGPSIVLIAF